MPKPKQRSKVRLRGCAESHCYQSWNRSHIELLPGCTDDSRNSVSRVVAGFLPSPWVELSPAVCQCDRTDCFRLQIHTRRSLLTPLPLYSRQGFEPWRRAQSVRPPAETLGIRLQDPPK